MNILSRIKIKETIRVSKKGLLKLLSENQHMAQQITELQTSNTKLVLEIRALKGKLANAESEPRSGSDDARTTPRGSCTTTYWNPSAS